MDDYDFTAKSRKRVDEMNRALNGMHLSIVLIFVFCIAATLMAWFYLF